MLKGCNDTYFSFKRAKSFIKLKKDYIPGLGNIADFTIISRGHNIKDK